MKKIMILGGSENQMPLIECAKDQGYYIVLCDYAEDNMGKEHADVFHCVSILDREAVLEVAEEEEIDGIVTNSEPAMLIATYVSNCIDIASNPYESILILSRKDLFRKFLKENGFNCPQAYADDDYRSIIENIEGFKYPLIVKPIDSSGSRGVSKIYCLDELEGAFNTAKAFSKKKRVMIEEFIERTHDYMIGGDIFVFDGEVKFWGIMNSMRDKSVNECVPAGTSYPSFVDDEKLEIIKTTINSIVSLLKIEFGPFNLEAMFDKEDRMFLVEINPRNGGNKIPEMLKIISGVDLIKANIEASMGEKDLSLSHAKSFKNMSTYVIHADRSGIFRAIKYSDEIRDNILEIDMKKQICDKVEKFDSADKFMGIIFLEFHSLDEMKYKLENIKKLIKIDIE